MFPASELVQGPQDVIDEDQVPHDPGIVECRCEPEFVPIEQTEVLRDEEPVRLGMDGTLGSDGVCSSGARQADDAVVRGWDCADADVTVIVLAIWG